MRRNMSSWRMRKRRKNRRSRRREARKRRQRRKKGGGGGECDLDDGLADEGVQVGHELAVDVSHVEVLGDYSDEAHSTVTDPQVGMTQERSCREKKRGREGGSERDRKMKQF